MLGSAMLSGARCWLVENAPLEPRSTSRYGLWINIVIAKSFRGHLGKVCPKSKKILNRRTLMAHKENPRKSDRHEDQAKVTNGLYTVDIEMRDGKASRATGVLVLCDGRILGGDSYFYYAGSYTFRNGKWRGELITQQHSKAVGKNLAFGGREVSCGFTGTYSDGRAEVDGTALVGKTSVPFHAALTLKEAL
jgi:hypothetical protein